MANSEIVTNLLRFIVLVLLQVLLFNHINFLGYINPFVYVLFILMFPLTGNKTLLIFLSFLLGLSVDMFSDTGGVHAGASVFIAWVRPVILKYSFGVSYEYNAINVGRAYISQQVTYIGSMVLLHHLILFSLEIFSFSHILLVLKYALFSGIFSFVLIHSLVLLFSRKKT